ncbi:MAG: cytochrome P450 [Ilumatobacteraceae bacterium]
MILGVGDPEYAGTYEELMNVSLEAFAYAQALGEDRAKNPRDDITSRLMAAEVDGDRLTPQEFGSFFILLVVAGNETTRNAISHGIKALTDHPDQRELLYSDFATHSRTAMEEIVRWATPVIHFRRTATEDTVVGGQKIEAGQKLVMFYNSANRDASQYEDPYRFDVTRPINPAQVGFGGGGPHFCLGANRPPGDDGDVRRDPAADPDPARHERAGLPAERSSTGSSGCAAPGEISGWAEASTVHLGDACGWVEGRLAP